MYRPLCLIVTLAFTFSTVFGGTAWGYRVPVKIDVDTLEDVPAGLNLPTAVLDGNNIYLVSGYDDAIGWSDAVYRYDIDGDTWSTETEGSDPLEAIPTPRTESCNTGLIDGFDKFCVIGGAEGTGFTYDGPSDAVECYDPAANSWSSLDPLPTAVTGQYCAVHDGIIYVTGGYTGSVFNTALWWLDTQNTGDGWQTATAAAVRPVQSFNGRGAITRDPDLGGGEYRFTQFLGSSDQSTHFGLDSEGWTTLAAYTDRVYSCVLEDGPDHTLILGGGDYDGVTPYPTTDEILSFNSNDDSWTVATGTLPYTRAGMACVQDDEGNVYMFSGYSTDAGKDEKTGARLHLFRANVVLLLALIVVANYIYLIYHGPFSQLKATVRTSGNDTPQDAPMEDGGNGTARVPLPNDAAAGPAKITIQNTETGRADTRPFTIENGSANDWTFNDNFGYSAYMGTYMLPPDAFGMPQTAPGMIGPWTAEDDDGEFQYSLKFRATFKGQGNDENDDYAMELSDPSDAADGRFFAPLFPFQSHEATVTYEASFEDGDGLRFALFDEVGETPHEALFVDMTGGQLSVVDNVSKAETDCQTSLSTETWYAFKLAMDLDAGTMTVLVDDTETACQDVAVPFGDALPVQGLGFVLGDDVQGTSWIDNIMVNSIPEGTVDDDDDADDDADDDVTDDDAGGDDDDDAGDDDGAGGDDDDDDDDDGGCCGC